MEMLVSANPDKSSLNGNEVSFEQRARDLELQKTKEAEQEKLAKNSPFRRFYQINKDNSSYLTDLAKDNPTALRVLLFIFEHMDKLNALVCSYQVFQEALDISQASTARAIKHLKEKGYIHVLKSGTANVYIANDDLVWSSWGKNKDYCAFPSNVMLTRSEQEKRIKLKDTKVQMVEIK